MAEDYLLQTRRAVLPVMKAFGPLRDLVPTASIYPGTVPANAHPSVHRFGP
jgi:hypothetical protein